MREIAVGGRIGHVRLREALRGGSGSGCTETGIPPGCAEVLFCRLRLMPPARLPGRIGAGDEIPPREVADTDPAFAVKLRMLVFDDVR